MTQLILDGVPKHKRKMVEKNINDLVSMVFSETKNSVNVINITSDFEKAVEEFNAEGEPYNQNHDYGKAIAKTLHVINQDEVSFTIILDSIAFKAWTENDYFFLTTTLLHELVHVAYYARKFSCVGPEKFSEKPKKKFNRLVHTAETIWTEYEANRFVIEIFQDVLRDMGGTITFNTMFGHLETLSNMLENFHEYVKKEIDNFRSFKISITEITFQFTKKIGEILILCGYVYAYINPPKEFTEKMVILEKLEGYTFLLSENWSKIHSELKELYVQRKNYAPERITVIAKIIDSIYLVCGLKISDIDDEGYYVNILDVE